MQFWLSSLFYFHFRFTAGVLLNKSNSVYIRHLKVSGSPSIRSQPYLCHPDADGRFSRGNLRGRWVSCYYWGRCHYRGISTARRARHYNMKTACHHDLSGCIYCMFVNECRAGCCVWSSRIIMGSCGVRLWTRCAGNSFRGMLLWLLWFRFASF